MEAGVASLVELVQRIWATVLELPDVGPEDDFFDLGGDSIAGLRVAAEVAAALDLSAEDTEDLYAELFESPTARMFAEAIRAVANDVDRPSELHRSDAT